MDEGKNRQIRRLLEALGIRVLRLVRISIGPLTLDDLKKGAVRPLTEKEKDKIDQALNSGGETPFRPEKHPKNTTGACR